MTSDAKPLLIFDFDGTLANTIEIGVTIFNDVAPDFGIKQLAHNEILELRKLNIRAVLTRIGIGKLKAVKLATRIRNEIHTRMDEVEIFPGAEDAIRHLHESGFRMGIISSNNTENINEFVQRCGLAHCFEFVEAGVSLFGKSKRIKQVLKQQNVAASNAIYIGDETRDMEAARKSKVGSIAVCWGANEREAMITEGPTFCIDDPAELMACAEQYATG